MLNVCSDGRGDLLLNLLKASVGSDPKHLNLTAMLHMNLSAQFPFDRPAPGGYWRPHPATDRRKPAFATGSFANPSIWCRPRDRFWVVVPYRSRPGMLHLFAQHIHHVLQTQRLEYRVLVVEQLDVDVRFNRAKLFNAAVSEIARHTLERWLPRDRNASADAPNATHEPELLIQCQAPAPNSTTTGQQLPPVAQPVFSVDGQTVTLPPGRALSSPRACKPGIYRRPPVSLSNADECFLFHGAYRLHSFDDYCIQR